MTFVDSKKFSSLSCEQFERFAAKARLPTKLTLDTVNETVLRFAQVWRNPPPGIIDDTVRAAIEKHLRTIPLWTHSAGGSSSSG